MRATGAEDERLRVVPKRKAIHVWGFHSDTTDTDAEAYILEPLPSIDVGVTALKAKGQYASFKIAAAENDAKKMLELDFWTAGALVKPYYERRPQATSSPPAASGPRTRPTSAADETTIPETVAASTEDQPFLPPPAEGLSTAQPRRIQPERAGTKIKNK